MAAASSTINKSAYPYTFSVSYGNIYYINYLWVLYILILTIALLNSGLVDYITS